MNRRPMEYADLRDVMTLYLQGKIDRRVMVWAFGRWQSEGARI